MNMIRISRHDLPNPAKRISELEAELLRVRAELAEAYEYDNKQHAAIVRDTLEIGERKADRDALRARLQVVTDVLREWSAWTHTANVMVYPMALRKKTEAALTDALAGVPDAGGAREQYENWVMENGSATYWECWLAAQRAAPLPDAYSVTVQSRSAHLVKNKGDYHGEFTLCGRRYDNDLEPMSEHHKRFFEMGLGDVCLSCSNIYKSAALPPAPAAVVSVCKCGHARTEHLWDERCGSCYCTRYSAAPAAEGETK